MGTTLGSHATLAIGEALDATGKFAASASHHSQHSEKPRMTANGDTSSNTQRRINTSLSVIPKALPSSAEIVLETSTGSDIRPNAADERGFSAL
jgi:hypothetical protein